MIIIAGSIRLDPERVDAALEAGWPHIEGARGQRGCLAYQWALEPREPGRVEVFERWQDEAALAAHLEGPHYRNMLATLGAHGLQTAEVAKYRVDAHCPVYDEQGKARADFF